MITVTASSQNSPLAAMEDAERHYYGVQFHPEVTHTPQGQRMIERFVLDICACEARWTAANIIEDAIAQVRAQVGDANVLLGLSGGVDSSAVLAHLAEQQGDGVPVFSIGHTAKEFDEASMAEVTARHFKADRTRQFLHRFGERQVVVFHQKADRRAMGTTAKAVIELLVGTDCE